MFEEKTCLDRMRAMQEAAGEREFKDRVKVERTIDPREGPVIRITAERGLMGPFIKKAEEFQRRNNNKG